MSKISDSDLERWVTDELFWDPKVDNAAIALSANDGEVTLRGTVGSFRQKREAQTATERVYGVTSGVERRPLVATSRPW
jgi:osmotically-inducible protein OsmY